MTAGQPSHPIGAWQWDDGNLPKIASHGFSPRTVEEVAGGSPKFRANLRGRATTHQMIGPAGDGRWWTLCVMCVYEDVWRCVTGWPSTRRESEWYESVLGSREEESG